MLNCINVAFINWFHCGQDCTTTTSNISDNHPCRNPGGSTGAGGLMDFFGSPQGPQVILLKIDSFCKEDQYLEYWVSFKYFISAERRGSPNDSRKHGRKWRALSLSLISLGRKGQNLIRLGQKRQTLVNKERWTSRPPMNKPEPSEYSIEVEQHYATNWIKCLESNETHQLFVFRNTIKLFPLMLSLRMAME